METARIEAQLGTTLQLVRDAALDELDAEALLARDQPAATVMTNAALWLISPKVKGFSDNSVNQHLTRFLSVQ